MSLIIFLFVCFSFSPYLLVSLTHTLFLSVYLSVCLPQVSLTPNGLDMRMLRPYDAPLRRNFLPALKVEYSVSAKQKAYRVQINRVQVRLSHTTSQHIVYTCMFCYFAGIKTKHLSCVCRSKIRFLEPFSHLCSTQSNLLNQSEWTQVSNKLSWCTK